ncbi:MAG: restriction endonuclease subunit S [Culicoidibacterales bacterium]
MGNSRKPEIRFKGFDDDWEQRELGKILKTFPIRQFLADPDVNGNYAVIQQGDAPLIGYANGKPFSKFQGVTLFGDHTVSLYKPKAPFFVSTDGIKILGADNFEGNYLFTLLERYKLKSQGYKRHFSILKGQAAYFTENEQEQTKIGSFFKTLDDTINLHQRELEALKTTKKGFLQKMFPKEGENFPEIRFPGFTDDWKQRELEGLAQFSKGRGYAKKDLTSSGTPIILYGRLYTQYQTVISDVDTFVLSDGKSVLSEGNEILVPASGETAKDISRASVISQKGVILGGDLNIIRPKSKIDPIFLAITISNGSQKKEMMKRAQGKSVVHLQNSDLKKVLLNYPSLSEQTKIGSFFKTLDDTINLHQQELDYLKATKKAFLQKMFV